MLPLSASGPRLHGRLSSNVRPQMEPLVAASLGFACLLLFAISSVVVFWKSGQRRLTWPEWKAALREGRPWHVVAALSGLLFVLLLAFMRLSGVGK